MRKYIFWAKKIFEYYRYIRPYAVSNKYKDYLHSNTNISVFSNPRGGSTWLMTILSRIPGSITIDEPVNVMQNYPELNAVGFCPNPHIPEDADWPEAEAFFVKLFNREIKSIRSLGLYLQNPDLSRLSMCRYFIYKDCSSNMILPWLTKRFEINPIYILRHPCAVVASQLRYGNFWDYIKADPRAHLPDTRCKFQDIYGLYSDIISRIRTPVERLATEWSLYNAIPIRHPRNNQQWITVSYEELYSNPDAELERIFSRIGVPMPDGLPDSVRTPSASSLGGSHSDIFSGQQLSSWQRKLSKEEIKSILAITKEFQLDVYDDSPMPDLARIYSPNPA
jgi:hypothetical protein